MRPPRRPGETVADLALFGPLVASVILAALGHETTSTCTRTTWRRFVLAYLAWHTWRVWRWDPLRHLDELTRRVHHPGRCRCHHVVHAERPLASSLGPA